MNNTIENTSYSLAKFYDKICVEGGYFNYPLITEVLSTLLADKKEVLELCIGTGNIAIPLVEKGFNITGIDNDEIMLSILATKTDKITVVNSSAETFHLDKKFDAIYIHSGHLIFNKKEDDIFLNILNEDSMKNTFLSIAKHLNPDGLFIINIERWNDCTIKLADGSIFNRTIISDTEQEGQRIFWIFDTNTKTGKFHLGDLTTKISRKQVISELEKLGFSEFYNHLDMFFVCRFSTKL